jgi:predicted nucleotidyltransferase component of viral defense system
VTNPVSNVAASVRTRLLRLARERGEDYQLVLVRYANERLLYRLSKSRHAPRFVLKGATLFSVWTGAPHRATRDVDLLGTGDASESHIRDVFAEVIALELEDDGLEFDVDSTTVGPIREDREYAGVRVVLNARLTSAQLRLQIDIGFGDVVTPAAVTVEVPTLLDFPAPRLRAYPKETVIAEKLEAMVQLGLANSRMKDFYDLAVLSESFEFEGEKLVAAIRATFARRRTALPLELPIALTPEFTSDSAKRTQWSALSRKSGATEIGDLATVVMAITRFAVEPLKAAAAQASFRARWHPGGPWK